MNTYARLLERTLEKSMWKKKVVFIQSVHTFIMYIFTRFSQHEYFPLGPRGFNLEVVSQNTEFTVQYELCAPVSTHEQVVLQPHIVMSPALRLRGNIQYNFPQQRGEETLEPPKIGSTLSAELLWVY